MPLCAIARVNNPSACGETSSIWTAIAPADWPARWATQSLEQARLAFDGLKFSARQDTHWNVHLPPGYNARADTIKRQQLTLAGARLTQVLTAIFPN